uniref:Uncharacterized protein n=1 Tax=Anguilla anguilla TaxID=7936 RepID=A0A0E9SJ64_ANGAN
MTPDVTVLLFPGTTACGKGRKLLWAITLVWCSPSPTTRLC